MKKYLKEGKKRDINSGNPAWFVIHPDRTKESQKIIKMLDANGFQGWSTGGGCMSMVKSFADGTRCMVTDNDAGLDTLDSEMSIGFETEAGDPIFCISTKGKENIYILEGLC